MRSQSRVVCRITAPPLRVRDAAARTLPPRDISADEAKWGASLSSS